MKKITIFALCFAALFALQACNSKTTKLEGISKGQTDSLSIALGVYFADVLKSNQWTDEVNYSLLFSTIKKIRDGKDVGMTPMQINDVVNNYMMKKQAIVSEQNIKKGKDFLDKNKTEEGVVELPSGLQYKIVEEGAGVKPEAIDTVTVHYIGKLVDGTQFESSYERGEPATFPLGNVIQGWIEGFQQIKEGSKAILYIPSDLAYGPQQRSPEIGPNSTLIFEVELIKVSKAAPQPENKK